jgi:hypothetical protein
MSRGRHLVRTRGARLRTLEEVLARKRELIELGAAQRSAVAYDVSELSPVFAVGDKVVGAGRFLLARPLLLAAAGGFLVAFWPRRVISLAARGFALWNGVAAVRKLIATRG